MTITVDQFRAKFPEFILSTDQAIQFSIVEAVIIMGEDVDRWIDNSVYTMAQLYLVAHLATVADRTAQGDVTGIAPVKLQEVDDVRVQYAVKDMSINGIDEEFEGTVYGNRYIYYRRMCFSGWYVA